MPASQYLFEVYVYIKSIVREKQTLFWTIIFPITYLLLVTIIYGGGPRVRFDVIVVDMDNTEISRALVETMNSSGVFRVSLLDSSSDISVVMREGRYEAALIIPQGFGYNITHARQNMVTIVYIEGLPDSESAKAAIEGIVGSFGSLLIERWLNTARSYIHGEYFEYVAFLTKPITISYSTVEAVPLMTRGGIRMYYVLSTIGVMVLYSGLFTGLESILKVRGAGVIGVILSSPIESHKLFIANMLSGLVSIAITSASIMAVGLALGADVGLVSPAGWALIAFLLLVGAVGVMGLGYLIAPFVKSNEAATAIANAIAFPTMFLGGIAIPKFIIPPEVRVFSEIYPLSRIIEAARSIAVYGWDLHQAIEYSLPAIVVSIAVIIIGWTLYRRTLEHAVERP